MICLRIAQRWLCKLKYKYKDVCKDVFMDEHKRSDVVEDCKKFFRKIEKLKPYVLEFKKDGEMSANLLL